MEELYLFSNEKALLLILSVIRNDLLYIDFYHKQKHTFLKGFCLFRVINVIVLVDKLNQNKNGK